MLLLPKNSFFFPARNALATFKGPLVVLKLGCDTPEKIEITITRNHIDTAH
jgi:hypothetical protein